MDSILTFIAKKIWNYLGPKIEEKFAEIAPQILDLIESKLAEWLPQIVKTIAVAVAQSAGQLTVDSVDKVTDIIPGDLDDQIVDGIVRDVMTRIEGFLR